MIESGLVRGFGSSPHQAVVIERFAVETIAVLAAAAAAHVLAAGGRDESLRVHVLVDQHLRLGSG